MRTGQASPHRSFEFIGNTAYIVTLTGEIWKIEGVSCLPYPTVGRTRCAASRSDA